MNLQNDLKEVKDKLEAVVSAIETASPTLAERVFAAVEQELITAGYVKPAEPAQITAEGAQ